MPNIIDATGITIQTAAEILDELLNGTTDYEGMYSIYGSDINVAPNSPDAQMLNIVVQAKLDVLEFIQQIYTSFDPDQAVGVALDQRCAINGVYRQAGTRTLTDILVTVSQAVTLTGVDDDPDNPFTVSDAAGNQFQLVATHVFGAAGSATLAFQAKNLGPVTTVPNTITRIVTITLGVTTVNNPAVATSIGVAEESDYSLRIRRANSVALGSKGYLEGLYAAITNLDGVASVTIVEDIPAHSIWVVVDGGDTDEVANAIYIKRNAGVALVGATVVAITQVDGTIFYVQFDRPTSQNLWLSFDVEAIYGSYDPAYIRSQILSLLSYRIGQSADSASVVALVKQIAPNVSVTDEGVSANGSSYVNLLAPTASNYRFELAAARILINGVPG